MLGATTSPTALAGADMDVIREELLRLHEQALAAAVVAAGVACALDEQAVSSLGTARAVDWQGEAADRFRDRCLGLELELGGAAEQARLVFAALSDARATLEGEIAGAAA